MEDYTIVLNNKKIYDFYTKNKNLNIEEVNLIFIDLLEKICDNSNTAMTNSITKQVLDKVLVLESQMNKINQDINTSFILKFQEFRKDYLEDIKMILVSNTNDKIATLIEKYNTILQDKTRLLIHDLGSKNQETILSNMKILQDLVNKETVELTKGQLNRDAIDGFIANIDEKFSKTLLNSQNIVNSLLSSTEQRLEQKLNQIKDITYNNNTLNTTLHQNLNQMLTKMENSSLKGRISENLLYGILQNLYPTAEVNYVGTTAETGDIILTRKNKKSILFENKCYEGTVNKIEVDKFYRDVLNSQNKYNGIFISQKSGIVGKDNYEIEVQNSSNVLLFLHYANYDADKIKVAIEIVDHFYETVSSINPGQTDQEHTAKMISLEQDVLEEINREYKAFSIKKMNYISLIKESSQKLLSGIDDFKMPSLESILNKHFANSIVSKDFYCTNCNYVAKNMRALKAHMRGCSNRSGCENPDIGLETEDQDQESVQTSIQDSSVLVDTTMTKKKRGTK